MSHNSYSSPQTRAGSLVASELASEPLSPEALSRDALTDAWRGRCFYAGLLLACLGLALIWGMGGAERLFVHVSGTFLLADAAPLLLALGLTRPLVRSGDPSGPPFPVESPRKLNTPRNARTLRFPRCLRRPLVRFPGHPLIALPLWAIVLCAWHLTWLYEAASRHPGVRALMCATLLACGLNMWTCLIGVAPSPRWFDGRAKACGVLLSRLVAIALANVLLWSDVVFYSYYTRGDALHELSPLADQNIAGAIMLLQEALLAIGLLGWLLLNTAGARRRRQTVGARGLSDSTGAYDHSRALL